MAANNERVMSGVQGGQISRNEFLDLSQEMNGLSQLRDSYLGDNCQLTTDQQALVELRQKALQARIQKYETGVYRPAQVPVGMLQEAQHRQAGQLFNGLKDGTISRHEGQGVMLLQQHTAARHNRDNGNSIQALVDTARQGIDQARSGRETNAQESSLSGCGLPTPFGLNSFPKYGNPYIGFPGPSATSGLHR